MGIINIQMTGFAVLMICAMAGFEVAAYGGSHRVEYEETDMIQEGRVWEYFKYDLKYNDMDYADRYYDLCLLRYSFNGTETSGGKTYHRCILDEATIWRSKGAPNQGFPGPYEVSKMVLDRCVGLVRQDGRKIYMLLPSETVNQTADNYLRIEERPVSDGEEVILFDFSAQMEQTVECYMTSYSEGPMITSGFVNHTEEVLDGVLGRQLRRIELCNEAPPEGMGGWQYWDDIVMTIQSAWVEGVGNVGPGEMLRFGGIRNYAFDSSGVSERTRRHENGDASDDNIVDLYCGENSFFNNLYSSDGTVWYEGLGVSAPPVSSVNVGVAEENKTEKIYDMFGRQVDHMNPGSIYIVNGRKSICK